MQIYVKMFCQINKPFIQGRDFDRSVTDILNQLITLCVIYHILSFLANFIHPLHGLTIPQTLPPYKIYYESMYVFMRTTNDKYTKKCITLFYLSDKLFSSCSSQKAFHNCFIFKFRNSLATYTSLYYRISRLSLCWYFQVILSWTAMVASLVRRKYPKAFMAAVHASLSVLSAVRQRSKVEYFAFCITLMYVCMYICLELCMPFVFLCWKIACDNQKRIFFMLSAADCNCYSVVAFALAHLTRENTPVIDIRVVKENRKC